MDNIFRIYSRLSAIRKNLPEKPDIKEDYVKEYHDVVILLEKETKSSLEEFKVPNDKLKYQVTSVWPSIPSLGQKGGKTYSKDRYCEKAFLSAKIDALLSYFQFRYLNEQKPQVGFQVPEK